MDLKIADIKNALLPVGSLFATLPLSNRPNIGLGDPRRIGILDLVGPLD
jgi:hypothetical protein